MLDLRPEHTSGGSKAFNKDMQRHGIPTATKPSANWSAKAFMQKLGIPVVVKADGLAAGKGVVVAQAKSRPSTPLITYSAATVSVRDFRW